MKSPRDTFRLDKAAVGKHSNLADDQFVEYCLNTALLELLHRQSAEATFPEAAKQNSELAGAKKFVSIFLGLSSASKSDDASQQDRGLFTPGLLPEEEEDGEPRRRKKT